MPIVEAVLEKKFADGKPFWIAVIDGNEIPCYDPIIKDHKGKENPYEIATSGTGKKYLKVPKAGGYQGKGGGFSRGKSDREIYLGALTMSMSYSKDVIVAMIAHGYEFETNIESTLLSGYKKVSQAILADLKAIEGEAPKAPVSTLASVPQGTSATKAPTTPEKPRPVPKDDENLTIKEKLAKKMWSYLQNLHSDSDDNFKALLRELTEFTGKDGKAVFVDNLEKLSDKWAGSAYGKLEKMIEEEERKAVANADLGDIGF
jgi:hypothetical protein